MQGEVIDYGFASVGARRVNGKRGCRMVLIDNKNDLSKTNYQLRHQLSRFLLVYYQCHIRSKSACEQRLKGLN